MIHTQKKKNKFFTFIFSMVPGAAEMYMGFLKNGLSLLLVCMVCVFLCGGFGELFLVPLAITWIYGFFHAWNIAGLNDEDFYASRDEYIWEEFIDPRDFSIPEDKVKKVLPIALLFVGFGIVWNYVFSIVINFIPGDYWNIVYPIVKGIPGLVFAILFIILGFKLLKEKKKQIDLEDEMPILIERNDDAYAALETDTESENASDIESEDSKDEAKDVIEESSDK